jgi:primosomal replication protein N
VNRLLLSARLQERGATRYTPAGLPALDLVLAHRSEVTQSGHRRQVSLEMKALAVGEITAALATLPLGSTARFGGFVAGARNGRGCLFHVTEFEAEAAESVAL